MKNWDKLFKNTKFKQIIKSNWKKAGLIIAIIIIIVSYIKIIHNHFEKVRYANNVIEIAQKNENTIFSVEKVYVCSSANAVGTTSTQNNGQFNIYQYTDMAVFINNNQEKFGLTNENTVKELYIDNIDLQVNKNMGSQSLKYTNLKKIGSRETVRDFTKKDRIDFNIVYTNKENEMANYDDNVFYTDCSNPISLKYVNDLGTNYSVDEGNSVKFDGSILKDAGIAIEDINARVKFKINIVNNNDEYFSCWINLDMPLNEIYNGTSIKSKTTTGPTYDLFKS